MGNYILKNDLPILRLNNWAMEAFHNELKQIIDSLNLSNISGLQNFLEKIDQDIYGRGCIYAELTNFFDTNDPNKVSLELLQKLTEKVIEKIKKEKNYHPDLITLLENFKMHLVTQ